MVWVAGLGPKQRTLTVMRTEWHNRVFCPCGGLAYSRHRNTILLVLAEVLFRLCMQHCISRSCRPALPGKAVRCNKHPALPGDAAGACQMPQGELVPRYRCGCSHLDTLQRAFGADPSVHEGSFISEQSWSNTPAAYTHTTEISLQF